MGDRPEVHDAAAPFRRPPHRRGVQQVPAGGQVEPGDLVAEVLKVSGDRGAHLAAVPGNQNAHRSMISGREGPRQRFPVAGRPGKGKTATGCCSTLTAMRTG